MFVIAILSLNVLRQIVSLPTDWAFKHLNIFFTIQAFAMHVIVILKICISFANA